MVVISGNNPPQDTTISIALRENFIRKAYLSILARTPTELEVIGAKQLLDKNNCSIENRKELLELLFSDPQYKINLYQTENSALLNAASPEYINAYILYYESLLTDTTSPYFILYSSYIAPLQKLKKLYRKYMNDSASMVEVQQTMSCNVLYFNYHGGEYDWLTSACKYFLLRKPTLEELQSYQYMYAGFDAYLFQRRGKSMNEAFDIFFSSDEYYEGQIRRLFLQNVYREPSASQLAALASQYRSNQDYKKLLEQIFLTDDFLKR